MKEFQRKNNHRYDPIKRRPRVPLREEVDWPALPPGERKRKKPIPPNKRERRLPCIGQYDGKLKAERVKKNNNRYDPIKRRPRVPLREEVDWPALPPGERKRKKPIPPNKRERRLPCIGHNNGKLKAERVKKNNNRYDAIKRRQRVPLREEVDWPALPPGERKEKPIPLNKQKWRLPRSSHDCAHPVQRGKNNKRKRNEEDNDRDAGEERPAKRRTPKINESSKARTKNAKNAPAEFNINDFTFHKIIGQGGFGKIAMATHTATKRKVAVKAVKKKLLVKEGIQNIINEKEVLEKVGSISLFTHAYGTFQTEDYLFYVMEYLRGGNLYDLMKSKCPLSMDTIRFIAAEIICAMQYLHSIGIIHRDFKPANILFDESGHIKLADFGLSCLGVSGNKKTNTPAGTLNYAAPEIFLGMSYNRSVDYYSLGIILQEMAAKLEDCTYSPNNGRDLMDLILRLTEECPKIRLRACRNLRKHRFFKGIDWDKMETGMATPPFQLKLRKEIDTRKVIEVQKIMPIVKGKRIEMPPALKTQLQDFSFMTKSWRKGQSEL